MKSQSIIAQSERYTADGVVSMNRKAVALQAGLEKLFADVGITVTIAPDSSKKASTISQ